MKGTGRYMGLVRAIIERGRDEEKYVMVIRERYTVEAGRDSLGQCNS